MNEGMKILHIHYLWCVNGFSTCPKILRQGTSGFISRPKEGVLPIFIALKNSSPRPCLNPRPLGPVASTLTTIPPRRVEFHTWRDNLLMNWVQKDYAAWSWIIWYGIDKSTAINGFSNVHYRKPFSRQTWQRHRFVCTSSKSLVVATYSSEILPPAGAPAWISLVRSA
jgi:hypothetical protein